MRRRVPGLADGRLHHRCATGGGWRQRAGGLSVLQYRGGEGAAGMMEPDALFHRPCFTILSAIRFGGWRASPRRLDGRTYMMRASGWSVLTLRAAINASSASTTMWSALLFSLSPTVKRIGPPKGPRLSALSAGRR